ncbi:phosphatidylinositol-specific phospholipase C1-like protein [Silvibacterium dinghuense]|nr:phosphatidylinositol-specific phospholipase C1-like protein [Silvibacterium dinghuense]
MLKTGMARGTSAIVWCALAATGVAAAQNDDSVRMNQIQVIGTHNSYHAGFAPSAAKYWQEKAPKVYEGLNYSHPTLTAQLDGGVRQLEIDIFPDTKGGLFAHPYGEKAIAEAGLPADPPYNADGVMDKPGFKVLHVQDIDYRSRCEPFTACLAEVRKWSKAHPHHLPVFLLIENKYGKLKDVPFPTVTPEEWTPAIFDDLDKEIRSVFPESEIITPDDVRGKYATLNEAIRAGNWPTLKQARGKVIFLLDQRRYESMYTEGHPALQGRILFTNAVPGAPDAAFTEENDGTPEEIDALVKQGYLVRTRSDEPGREAPKNDTSRRDVVLKTGAQIISTDYPAAEKHASGYEVELPGNAVARCNPVLQPAGCTDSGLAAKK